MSAKTDHFHARFRHDQLATGFDAAALRLAGVTEELDRAEDNLRRRDEDAIEAVTAVATPQAAPGRRNCPDHLYVRIYG